MKAMICIVFIASVLVASAQTNYVIELDPESYEEYSSYWTTNNLEAVDEESGRIRMFVTKEEYEVDAIAKPKDRLKNIPKAKIDQAKVNAANYKATLKQFDKDMIEYNEKQVKKATDNLAAQ